MTMDIRIFSLCETPEKLHEVTACFQQQWASEDSMRVYEDALRRCIGAKNSLPQWYWMQDGDGIVDRTGLITNDFISRGELQPWLCVLYISPRYHGHGLAFRLIEHIARQTRQLGPTRLRLCADLGSLYEKAGSYFDGPDYHPWEEVSRVYSHNLQAYNCCASVRPGKLQDYNTTPFILSRAIGKGNRVTNHRFTHHF